MAVLGLILAFIANIGWFSDSKKVDFFQQIKNNQEVSPDHPRAKNFLKEYFYILPMIEEEKNIAIDKIVLVGLFQNHGENKDFISGVIKARNVNGEVSPGLCSLSELKTWSETTPLWNWVAWGIIAISIIIEIGIFIFEQGKKM